MNFLTLIDYIGTFAFAISGIRLASAKRFDWFGAYVVGFVTAVGGGTIRDLLLDVTPFWMLQSSYLIVTALALGFVILFGRYVIRLNNTFFIFDAIGLGLFAVVGIEKSITYGYPMWVGLIMGTLTGAAGGVLRDTLINEVPLIFRKEIYALACVFGGLVYYLCLYSGGVRRISSFLLPVSPWGDREGVSLFSLFSLFAKALLVLASLILCWLTSPPRRPASFLASCWASHGSMRRLSPGDEKLVSFTSNSA